MKGLVTILALLCFNSFCMGACPERIKEFYTAYMTSVLEGDADKSALCREYLTQGMIEKIGRVSNATGADPVIRAQDANRDAVETLSVEALGNDWYMIRYLWTKGDNNTLTEIPLKAQKVGGVCRITYITPVWNGSRYGDELLACGGGAAKIDQTSGLSFLKSFYDAYTAVYCKMPGDLTAKLADLRARCLSQHAAEQFEAAESENRLDGVDGYDRLIAGFDFDCLWRKSIECTHLNGDEYQITYRAGDRTHKIVVAVKKSADGYRIAGFPRQGL